MGDARRRFPELPIILEIHEEAVTDLVAMEHIGLALKALNMGLAYDDFGAGNARLQELAAAPPDIVKFDIALIQDIDKAPPNRLEMVQRLVDMVHRMGIKALAEGVSNPAEDKACIRLGFDLLQGFHYGRPGPLGV